MTHIRHPGPIFRTKTQSIKNQIYSSIVDIIGDICQCFYCSLKEAKVSILDRDAGAKAILELAGKKQHSEGIRDLEEDEAPMSEEMKKKMNVIPKMM